MAKDKSLKLNFNILKGSEKIFLFLMLCMLVGSIIGSIIANRIDGVQFNSLITYMDNLFYDFNNISLLKQEILREGLFKYGISIIIIWLLGFASLGNFVTLFIITLKGTSLGFTTSFLMMEYGFKGIWYATIIYLPQNIILVPLYIFIAHTSIKFNLKKNKKDAKISVLDIETLEYAVVLGLGLSLIFLTSLYEAYVAPNIINITLLG